VPEQAPPPPAYPEPATCASPAPKEPAAAQARGLRQVLQTAHPDAVSSLAASAGGLLATTSKHSLRIWDIERRMLLRVFPDGGENARVAFFEGDTKVVVASAHDVRTFDLAREDDRPAASRTFVNGPGPEIVAMGGDRAALAMLRGNKVEILDASLEASRAFDLPADARTVGSPSIAARPGRIAVASSNDRVFLWSGGDSLRAFPVLGVRGVAFAADGSVVTLREDKCAAIVSRHSVAPDGSLGAASDVARFEATCPRAEMGRRRFAMSLDAAASRVLVAVDDETALVDLEKRTVKRGPTGSAYADHVVLSGSKIVADTRELRVLGVEEFQFIGDFPAARAQDSDAADVVHVDAKHAIVVAAGSAPATGNLSLTLSEWSLETGAFVRQKKLDTGDDETPRFVRSHLGHPQWIFEERGTLKKCGEGSETLSLHAIDLLDAFSAAPKKRMLGCIPRARFDAPAYVEAMAKKRHWELSPGSGFFEIVDVDLGRSRALVRNVWTAREINEYAGELAVVDLATGKSRVLAESGELFIRGNIMMLPERQLDGFRGGPLGFSFDGALVVRKASSPKAPTIAWRTDTGKRVPDLTPAELAAIEHADPSATSDGAHAELGADGVLTMHSRSGAVSARLAHFTDDEWIAFTPDGAYTGSPEVEDRVAFVFDAPMEPFRFERFAPSFRRPDVVASRLRGGSDDVPTSVARPPRLSLRSQAVRGDAIGGATLSASIDVASRSSRVEKVRVHVEGRLVVEKAVCAQEAAVQVDAPLLPGKNRVTFTAYDALGAASNELATEVAAPAGARRPDLYIVAFGVNRYPNFGATEQLELADDDARGIAAAFAAQAGTPDARFGSAHTTVLTDDGVTVPAIESALTSLESMRPDDVAIVFFAGHGVKPAENADMVFVTGAAGRDTESLLKASIGWRAIRDHLSRARGRVLVLLDACHSGHVTQELLVPNDDLVSSLLAEHRAGITVLSASKGRQVSYEPEGARGLALTADTAPLVTLPASPHGYFTGSIIAALGDRASDHDRDGEIELGELIDEVSRRVAAATQGRQTPWVARRETIGDFAVARAPRRE
jgi:uncharacterized caspase-like protein